MTTKYNIHEDEISEMDDSLIKVFLEFSQLKNIYRQGWLNNGVSKEHCESVADHSFGVCVLSYFIIKELGLSLDLNKVLAMSLIHEVGEIYAGDITPKEGITEDERIKREQASATKVLSKLSRDEDYLKLWLEFEQEKTPEAKFVKEVDKLEMFLQIAIYEKIGYKELKKYFSKNVSRIKDSQLMGILEKISQMKYGEDAVKKCNKIK